MGKNREAVAFAKKIIEVNAFKPKADPACTQCSGTGRCEEISGHNGDPYDSTCLCMNRNRPPALHFSQFDNRLILLARHYLRGT